MYGSAMDSGAQSKRWHWPRTGWSNPEWQRPNPHRKRARKLAGNSFDVACVQREHSHLQQKVPFGFAHRVALPRIQYGLGQKKKWMSEKMGNVVKSMTETREPSISCITKTQICLVKDGSLNPWVIQVKFRLLILAHWGRRNKIWQPKAVLSLGYLVKQTFSAHQGFWQVIQPFFCQDN